MTDEDYVRLALDVARTARAAGNHPFGAILVGPDGSVLMESGNTMAIPATAPAMPNAC